MKRPQRATSITEMDALAASIFAGDAVQQGLKLQLRPSDVVITPYGKSGTTWTQQIVHTLRTGGDMDFDDISRVVPWIEVSALLGIDLDAEQRAHPRAFKSHLSWDLVPKGGRYINVVRDPCDAAVSMFHFQEGWFLEPGSIEIDAFVEHSLSHRRYFQHLISWWPRRNDPDVLFLSYEKMLEDPGAVIQRIAGFIDVDLDETLLTKTLSHSSFDFMLAHKDRFDDALLRAYTETQGGLPPGSDSAKVRAGATGSGRELSDETRARVQAVWAAEVTERYGFKDYQSMMAELR